MTADDITPSFDPWSVADDIDELIEEWDPTALEPAISILGDDWVNRRMLALRFKLDEIERIRAQYKQQLAVLFAEIDRLSERRDGQIESEQKSVVALTSQLQSYHAAVIADAERRGVPDKRIPKMIRMPHGDLRSQAGGNVVVEIEEGREADVVEWLERCGLAAAVRVTEPVPARRLPDKRKLQGLVKVGDDGEIVGIVNSDGEPMPHVQYRKRDRALWVELADGRTSKSWLSSQQ